MKKKGANNAVSEKEAERAASDKAAMERYLKFEAEERAEEFANKKKEKVRYKKHQVFKRSTHELDLYLSEKEKEDKENQKRKSNPVRIYNEKLKLYKTYKVTPPSKGLINEFRTTLNVPLEYIARELGVCKQAVLNYEENERKRILNIQILDRFAELMGLELVYYFVPKEKTPLQLIREKVSELIDELPEKQRMSYFISQKDIREKIKEEELDNYWVEKYAGVKKQQRLFLKTIDDIPKSLWKSKKPRKKKQV